MLIGQFGEIGIFGGTIHGNWLIRSYRSMFGKRLGSQWLRLRGRHKCYIVIVVWMKPVGDWKCHVEFELEYLTQYTKHAVTRKRQEY
jgi:hypothetical protein